MCLVPRTVAQAYIPMILALCRQKQVQGQPGIHSKFLPETQKEPGEEAGKETACRTHSHATDCHRTVRQGCKSGSGTEGVWALTPTAPSPALLLHVLMAGIEANIPVTYGIGSQRRGQSTGCQFIGQSPVHSIEAAC